MLDLLGGGDERQVSGRSILPFGFSDDLVPLFHEPLHPLTRLRLRGSTKQPEDFLQSFHVLLRLFEVGFEGDLQSLPVGGLCHFRQCLHQLALRTE